MPPEFEKEAVLPACTPIFMDYTLSQTVCLWGLLLGKKVCTWACSPAGLDGGWVGVGGACAALVSSLRVYLCRSLFRKNGRAVLMRALCPAWAGLGPGLCASAELGPNLARAWPALGTSASADLGPIFGRAWAALGLSLLMLGQC